MAGISASATSRRFHQSPFWRHSLAGHDATNMKDIAPTALVFVPSIDGISHNERELTTNEDMLAGLAVFHRVVAQVADGALGEPPRE